MDKVQNKESRNIIPSPETFREEPILHIQEITVSILGPDVFCV
jgi:hypothetical protein